MDNQPCIIVRRTRSGTRDVFLNLLFENGTVHSLFWRNALASSRNGLRQISGFGVSVFSLASSRAKTARVKQVETHQQVAWEGNSVGYACAAVILEILGTTLLPGAQEERLAGHMFAMYRAAEVPGMKHIVRVLADLGYCQQQMLNSSISRSDIEAILSEGLGIQSKFLALLPTNNRNTIA